MKIILMTLLLFIQSCSFYGVIGRNLDYLITDKAEDTFDLYYQQEKDFKKDIQSFLNTEKNLLKKVRNLLSSIRDDFSKNISNEEQWLKRSLQFKEVYLEAGEKIIPLIAKYLAILDKEQKNFVIKSWDKENKKIKKRIKKKSVSDIRRRLEKLFGNFNKKQNDIMIKHKGLHIERKKRRLARRLESQEKIKTLMIGNSKNQDQISKILLNSIGKNLDNNSIKKYVEFLYQIKGKIPSEKKKEILTRINQVIGILNTAIKYEY